VWEILTPLVSLFVGSAMAVSLGGRRNAYLNGFMIWCILVAAVAFYLGRDLGTVTARADRWPVGRGERREAEGG
jgi:hypothetical protein